jgi:hypothetical protein
MQPFDVRELWRAGLKPEDAVQSCACCGAMPARVTNVSGEEKRRCAGCYERDMALNNDHWMN